MKAGLFEYANSQGRKKKHSGAGEFKRMTSSLASGPRRFQKSEASNGSPRTRAARRWMGPQSLGVEIERTPSDSGKIELNGERRDANLAASLGLVIWSFIVRFAELLFEPERQSELLYCFAHFYYQRGLTAEHVDLLGEALENVLAKSREDAEGPGTWSGNVALSWKWLWADLSRKLSQELTARALQYNEIVVEVWRTVSEETDLAELGNRFWSDVNEEAPDQVHLFRRPLKMWGHLLHHIMEMLMVSVYDPENFYADLKDLTLKHIQLGVRAEALFPFGTAMQYTLQKFMGDRWGPDSEEAWKHVWRRAALSMMRGLGIADNLMTGALVKGNVEALEQAMAQVPRSRRADWLCKIEVNGKIINPLYWALKDGKFAIAEFVLTDLLTIRADLGGYYYHMEELFTTHEDLVGVLAKECKPLVNILLDGVMWHSREKLPGHLVRVNYYIKHLYGNPSTYRDTWTSPLARLIQLGDNEVFKHPAVLKVLELKWYQFGLICFCLMQAWFSLMLGIYMIMVVYDPTRCDSSFDPANQLLRGMALITLMVLAFQVTSQIKRKKFVRFKLHRHLETEFLVPRTLANVYDIARIIACLLMLVGSNDSFDCESAELNATETNTTVRWFHHGVDHEIAGMASRMLLAVKKSSGVDGEDVIVNDIDTQRMRWSLVGLCLWFQFFQATILSTPMAAFIYTIGMMITDLSHSLIMIVILMLAFGSSLYVMDEYPFNDSFSDTVVQLISEVLGMSQVSYISLSGYAQGLLITFLTFVVVVMLNVLIAQLTITYDQVASDKEGFALRYRASVCLDIESALSLSWRKAIFESLGFDVPLPFSASDEGPSGGIQTLEPEDCPRYVPDRIFRYSGDGSPLDPWPLPGWNASDETILRNDIPPAVREEQQRAARALHRSNSHRSIRSARRDAMA